MSCEGKPKYGRRFPRLLHYSAFFRPLSGLAISFMPRLWESFMPEYRPRAGAQLIGFAIANILEKLEADTLQAPGLSLQPIRKGEYLLLQRWPMCGTAPRSRRTSRLHRIVRNEHSRLDPEVGRQLPDVVQVDFPVSGQQLRHR